MKEIDTLLSFVRTGSLPGRGSTQPESKSIADAKPDRSPTEAEMDSLCQSVINFVEGQLREIYDRSPHASQGPLRFFVMNLPLPVSSSIVIRSVITGSQVELVESKSQLPDIRPPPPQLVLSSLLTESDDILPSTVIVDPELTSPVIQSVPKLMESTPVLSDPTESTSKLSDSVPVTESSLAETIAKQAVISESKSATPLPSTVVSRPIRSGPCKIAYLGTYQSGIRTSYLSTRISVSGSLPQKELDSMKFGIQNSLIESFQELSSFVLQRLPPDKKSDARMSAMKGILEQLMALPSISTDEDAALLQRWCTSITSAWSNELTRMAWRRNLHRYMVPYILHN